MEVLNRPKGPEEGAKEATNNLLNQENSKDSSSKNSSKDAVTAIKEFVPAQKEAPSATSTNVLNFIETPKLEVMVRGLSFQYQLTESDVRRVFSRYGEVLSVDIETTKELGGAAYVQFKNFTAAMSAWTDLDGKQLHGIKGAILNVDCPKLSKPKESVVDKNSVKLIPTDDRATVISSSEAAGKKNSGKNGTKEEIEARASVLMAQFRGSGADAERKYTCRILIGIENDKEYRVGSKVIQIARRIWQELPAFQQNGGKTRLRGKGVGGKHESDEELALCISCKDATAFEAAVQFASEQINRIRQEFCRHCEDSSLEVPQYEACRPISDHAHTVAPWRTPFMGNPYDSYRTSQASIRGGTLYFQDNAAEGTGMNAGNAAFTQEFAQEAMRATTGSISGGLGFQQPGLFMPSAQPPIQQPQVVAAAQQAPTRQTWGYSPPRPSRSNNPRAWQERASWGQANDSSWAYPRNRDSYRLDPEMMEIDRLINQRNRARGSGDYKKADDIRKQLQSWGVVLMDQKGGGKSGKKTSWRYWNE